MKLDGMPLRYLIGGDDESEGKEGEVLEQSYDASTAPLHGFSIKYGNLFDEKNSGDYGPYLEPGDTAEEYNEGQIDPNGEGWNRNLDDQFRRAIDGEFQAIELDNADSYSLNDVLGAVEQCYAAGLYTVAKNPMLCRPEARILDYVKHPAIIGIIVERNCGTPHEMDSLRVFAGKPTLPVWFVSFGKGKKWAENTAREIAEADYRNMGVTYSGDGEYEESEDVYTPQPPDQPETPVVEIAVTAPPGVKVTINQVKT